MARGDNVASKIRRKRQVTKARNLTAKYPARRVMLYTGALIFPKGNLENPFIPAALN